MTERNLIKIKISIPLSDNFWIKYFDCETIEKSVFALTKKLSSNTKFYSETKTSTLEVKLTDFKNLLENYFLNFKKENKQRRTKALLKLIKTDLNYRLYSFLDYPTWSNNDRSNKKKQFSKTQKFNNESDFLGFFQRLISQDNFKGKKVIVKPNFVSAEGYPETTDKVFLAQIISILEINQPRSLQIFEGPSIFYDDSFLEKFNAGCFIRNTLTSKHLVRVEDDRRGMSFFIERDILESDFLINIACLKKHLSADFSASKKNLMGLLPAFERIKFHKIQKLNLAIDFLAEKLSPTYNIIDARKVLDKAQMKRLGGQSRKGRGIYFSTDSFELDKLAIKENFNEEKTVS